MAKVRLKRLDRVYAGSPLYFLTLTTHDRKAVLATISVHETFRTFCERSQTYGVAVGRYVLMPDHVHLFAGFAPDAINLSHWIKSFKNAISKTLNTRGIMAPHWQKGFFDHVLRSAESYDEKWEYVRFNPVRAGLVLNSDDWEFQGEICKLDM